MREKNVLFKFLRTYNDQYECYHWQQLQQHVDFIIHPIEIFTSALADGFSLESEWQQVSSILLSLLLLFLEIFSHQR